MLVHSHILIPPPGPRPARPAAAAPDPRTRSPPWARARPPPAGRRAVVPQRLYLSAATVQAGLPRVHDKPGASAARASTARPPGRPSRLRSKFPYLRDLAPRGRAYGGAHARVLGPDLRPPAGPPAPPPPAPARPRCPPSRPAARAPRSGSWARFSSPGRKPAYGCTRPPRPARSARRSPRPVAPGPDHPAVPLRPTRSGRHPEPGRPPHPYLTRREPHAACRAPAGQDSPAPEPCQEPR